MLSMVNRSSRQGGGAATQSPAERFHSGSNPDLGFTLHHDVSESGGHSGGAIPVPIPNTADKSASVPYCTEVRESSGTTDRCQLTY
jgi:hypothetical protein